MRDDELRKAIAAERGELAVLLGGLPAHRWDERTLCAGWRVREVVAHVTMPFRYSTGRFLAEFVKAGANFNRLADRCARRDAATLSAATLTAALGDNANHPWRPPRGGYEGALTHDVIHGLDITVALGIDRQVPKESLRVVLAGLTTGTGRRFFGVNLAGIQLHAADLNWTYGSGTPLTAPAQDLALLLAGRTLPAGRLQGTPAPRFTRT